MSALKLVALILVVVVMGTVMQPARAEAMEPTTILTIVGVAVGVIIIIAVVVIANMRERQTGPVSFADEPPLKPRETAPPVAAEPAEPAMATNAGAVQGS